MQSQGRAAAFAVNQTANNFARLPTPLAANPANALHGLAP